MNKYFCKILFFAICFVWTLYPSQVSADSIALPGDKADYVLTITDPQTNDSWEWQLSDNCSNVDIMREVVRGESTDEEQVFLNSVEVDVTPYIKQTLDKATQKTLSASHTDGITIKTGFKYSANASRNTVRMYSTSGSTTNRGIYYASNRHTTWRNPGAGVSGQKYPSSGSWNYTISSTEGAYYFSNPPFSFAECRVNISGMTAYRNISILCSLNSGLA